jgi:hypothetical protein
MTKTYRQKRLLRVLALRAGLGPTCDGQRWTPKRLKEKGVKP